MTLLANEVPPEPVAPPPAVDANAPPPAKEAVAETPPAHTQKADPKTVDPKAVAYDPELYGAADPKTGRPEKVPSKFWDYERKQIRMGDWLAQYEYAEKRLGKKFEKPPEEYELKSDEEVKFPSELTGDPVYKAMAAWAKEEGELSQGQFASMMRRFVVAQNSTLKEIQQQELKSLGPEGPARVRRMQDFLSASLSKENYARAEAMVQRVSDLEVMEELLQLALPAKLEKGDSYETGDSEEILRDLQTAKDQYGNRKMASDPKYAAMVRSRRAAFEARKSQR